MSSAGGNDLVPYIFFSYARSDLDAYLGRFFEDLSKRSAQTLGLGEAKVSFIDTASIKTGEDWNTRIAAALQVSKVLVCVYSPNFFSKERAHEYCAKEFDAFLKRHSDLHYDQIVEAGQPIFRIRDARNIVPILWLGELDLAPQGLPPSVVRAITYSLNQIDARFQGRVSDTYKSNGMEQFARRRSATYWEIIAALARLIRQYADNPLPPTPNPPEFASLRNAFWDPPPGAAVASVPSQVAPAIEQRVTGNLGPRQLLSLEIRLAVRNDRPWTPYAGEQSLRGMVEEAVTSRRLVCTSALFDPGVPGFLERAQQALEAASAANTSVILFVHPECLAEDDVRSVLESLLAHGSWRGGVLVPIDSADRSSADIVARHPGVFQLSPEQQQRISIRKVIGSPTDFRVAVISLLDEIVARIVKHGDIQRASPDNAGPDKRPNITNAGSAATDR